MKIACLLCHESGIAGKTIYDHTYEELGADDAWAAIQGSSLENMLELDRGTNLYPFLVAASRGGVSKNLDLVYHLIRRMPTKISPEWNGHEFGAADISVQVRKRKYQSENYIPDRD